MGSEEDGGRKEVELPSGAPKSRKYYHFKNVYNIYIKHN